MLGLDDRDVKQSRDLVGLDESSLLLAEHHNLEAVEVGEVGALGLGSALLGPAGGGPLAGNVGLFEGGLHLGEGGVAGDLDPEVRQGQPPVVDLLAVEGALLVGLSAVDEALRKRRGERKPKSTTPGTHTRTTQTRQTTHQATYPDTLKLGIDRHCDHVKARSLQRQQKAK